MTTDNLNEEIALWQQQDEQVCLDIILDHQMKDWSNRATEYFKQELNRRKMND